MRKSDKYPVGVLIGGRDCGKTTFMMGNKALNIEGYVPAKVRQEGLKGAIVIDTMREREEYAQVRKINHPSEYVRGPVHLIVTAENRAELARWIFDHVKDTLILVEDARMIIPKSIAGTPWEGLAIQSKNSHCPFWAIYHSWMAVPKELYSYLDLIELFKVKQHPQNRRNDIMNYEEILEAYERVKAHKSPYYHETVSNGS